MNNARVEEIDSWNFSSSTLGFDTCRNGVRNFGGLVGMRFRGFGVELESKEYEVPYQITSTKHLYDF